MSGSQEERKGGELDESYAPNSLIRFAVWGRERGRRRSKAK